MSELVWLRDIINKSRVYPGGSAKWDLSELMEGQDEGGRKAGRAESVGHQGGGAVYSVRKERR